MLASITKSWAGLAGLLFLFLLIAQFIAYFNYSNMAQVAAVKLGDWLEEANIGAVWLLIGFVFVTFARRPHHARGDREMGHPRADLHPALPPPRRRAADGARRLPRRRLAGQRDHAADGVLPADRHLHQRYKKDAGIGTVVSMMLPYVLILSVIWTAFFVAWYLVGIPLGPGSPVHLD